MLECTLRRTYAPSELLAKHPPKLRNLNKQLVFELACPPAATHGGAIEVTRWAAAPLPYAADLKATDIGPVAGHFAYDGADGIWHVNFADPRLFAAYGSSLLAQDELQVAEHPLLGSVREALRAEGLPALTEDALGPTPILVAGVERRCAIDTAPTHDAPGRRQGLYGNRFAAAAPDVVRGAVRVLDPPTRTNLIAIAAPVGRRGPYGRAELERILVTAFTGFSAAIVESRRRWPDAPVEVRTGFWGCGAFGGNRRTMTLLQLLAGRLAGLDRLRYFVFDSRGEADFRSGEADLASILGPPQEPLAVLLERLEDLDYEWGSSDGN